MFRKQARDSAYQQLDNTFEKPHSAWKKYEPC
jgi:hypothetical protein